MGKKHNMYFRYLLIAILSISSDVASAQVRQIDIRQAIDIALVNNYSLRADSLNIAVAGLKNKQLAASYLPQVNASNRFNYNPAITTQMLPGSVAGQPSKDFIPVQFGTRYDAASSIEISQTVYKKDLLLQMRAAGLYSGIAQTRHQLTKEEVVYQVAHGFYSLQSSGEMIRTTTKDFLNLKDIVTIATAQFESGTLKRVDLESLQINLANKEAHLNQLITQFNEQLHFFKFLLGLPATDTLLISDSISLQPATNHNNTEDLSKREDIRLYGQLIRAKEVDVKSVRAENVPTISSYFKYSYQSQFSKPGNVFDTDNWFKSSTLGLTMTVPLFDGYRRKSRLNIAQTELQQLKIQRVEKVQRAITEWRTSREKLENNLRQLETNTANLTLAEKVFGTRKALYGEGVTSLIELLDAERELSQARNLHMQSMIDVLTGHLDIHKTKGTLLTEYLNTL